MSWRCGLQVEADLEEIETLERAAYAFAVKHLPELGSERKFTRCRNQEPEQVATLQP